LAQVATSQSVLDTASQECRSFETGEFSVSDAAIQTADLTGNGEPDQIIDAGEFTCTSMASAYCGTGGCSITAIVAGNAYEFLGSDWRVEPGKGGNPVLSMQIHWSACDYKADCRESFTWDSAGFVSIGTTFSNN
jgi:hypothetical protein